jgi:hypothetical protein
MADLSYRVNGLFTSFYPDTKAGEVAFNELATQTEGTGRIFTTHLAEVKKQLRAAGYTVAVTKVDNELTLEQMLDEFEALAP